MKIVAIDDEPFDGMRYLEPSASRRGLVEERTLPFLRAVVEGLPDDLDALVLASDLQGRALGPVPGPLPGEALADELVALLEVHELGAPDRVGVVLAGDLFVAEELDRRGGLGDVSAVWRRFGERFRWVAGVAGNHDDLDSLEPHARVHVVDGEVVELDSIRLGGVGGIVGRPTKANRRTEADQLRLIEETLARRPDVLVLHEGPDDPDRALDGHAGIRQALLRAARPGCLVVCGHDHWSQPLTLIGGTTQVVNVDGPVLVLVRPVSR